MSIKGKAYIAGIYEHPTRKALISRSPRPQRAPHMHSRMPDWGWTMSMHITVRATHRVWARCQ